MTYKSKDSGRTVLDEVSDMPYSDDVADSSFYLKEAYGFEADFPEEVYEVRCGGRRLYLGGSYERAWRTFNDAEYKFL